MRERFGTAGLALLAIVCCAGLPLLLAAGLSAAAFAWVGGIALGAVVFAAAVALLLVRGRRASLRKDVQVR